MAIPGSLRGPQSDDLDPLAMPEAGPLEPFAQGPVGGPALQVVAPPAQIDTTHTVGSQSTTQSVKPTEQHKADLAQHAAAGQTQVTAEGEIAAAKKTLAEKEAEQTEAAAKLEKEIADRKAAALVEHQARIAAAMGDERAARQKMIEDGNVRSYWEDKGAPLRILSAFVTGMADYAHIRAGGEGPSLASQQLDDEIAKDRQAKIDKFTRSEKFHTLAKENVGAARDALADELKQIDHQAIAQRELMTRQWAAVAARAKVPLAEAEAKKEVGKTAAETAKADAILQETLAKKTSFTSPRTDETHTINDQGANAKGAKATESEAKFAMYGRQMHSAINVIEKLPPLSKDSLAKIQDAWTAYDAAEKGAEGGFGAALTILGRKLEIVPRSPSEFLTPDEQVVFNAGQKYVNAAMRTESGAAIGIQENKNAFLRNLPSAGDSDSVRAQKMKDMHDTADDFSALGGSATAKLDAARAAKEAPKTETKTETRPPPKKDANTAREVLKAQDWLKKHKTAAPELIEAVHKRLKELGAE